jgi:serine protease Do
MTASTVRESSAFWTTAAPLRAGMKEGDVVVQLNGTAVTTREALIEAIRQYSPGDKVRLTIRRGADQIARWMPRSGNSTASCMETGRTFKTPWAVSSANGAAGFPLAIQHDTVLSPSQCGGPIVDIQGRAVGLNIARASRVGSYAIPSSAIQPLLEELKTGRMVTATVAD